MYICPLLAYHLKDDISMYICLLVNRGEGGVEEMSQWLKALVALLRDHVQFIAPTWHLTIICNSSSRGAHILFVASVGTKHTCGAQTYMQAKHTPCMRTSFHSTGMCHASFYGREATRNSTHLWCL